MTRKLYIVSFLILMLMTPVYGDVNKSAGTTGAAFLKFGLGARPLALGGAYTGLSDDIYAVYYNPGGVALLDRAEGTFYHEQGFLGNRLNAGGFTAPVSKDLSYGVTIQTLYNNDFEQFDANNLRTGQFNISNIALNLHLSKRFNDRLGVGGNIKYIREKLADFSAKAFAGDLGARYWVLPKHLSLGIAVQNIGSGITFITEQGFLPLNVRGGLLFRPIPTLNLMLDINKYRDEKVKWHTGLEYWFMGKFAARLGYESVDDLGGHLDGITAGVGIRLDHTSTTTGSGIFSLSESQVDYAFVPKGNLGQTHKLSLSFKFGEPRDEIVAMKEERRREAKKKFKKMKQARAELKKLPEDVVKRLPPLERKIAVFSLNNKTALEDLDWLEAAFRDIIITGLEENNFRNVISTDVMDGAEKFFKRSGYTMERSIDRMRISDFLVADLLVDGELVFKRDKLKIILNVYDAADGDLLQKLSVKGYSDDIFEIGTDILEKTSAFLKKYKK